MKLLKSNKLKSLILSGTLAFSIFITGCSDNNHKINIENSNNTSINTEHNDTVVKNSNDTLEVPKESVEATIERVVDGDTIKLKLKETGDIVTLRLLLVDTPESVKKGVDPQPYSIEASNYAKETLKANDTVYIEYDEGSKTDKYDRHLGYLWFYSSESSTLEMFNEDIISKGYARVGYVYSQTRHLDRLKAVQDKAKLEGLNIWSVPGYVTDKGYDVDSYNKNKASGLSSNAVNNSSNTSSNIVYANGGSSTSNKYHVTEDAHNMKGAIKMTEDKAKSKGYIPCGICY